MVKSQDVAGFVLWGFDVQVAADELPSLGVVAAEAPSSRAGVTS